MLNQIIDPYKKFTKLDGHCRRGDGSNIFGDWEVIPISSALNTELGCIWVCISDPKCHGIVYSDQGCSKYLNPSINDISYEFVKEGEYCYIKLHDE